MWPELAHAVSVDEWEALEDPQGFRLEIMAGRVVKNPAPYLLHQLVVGSLLRALSAWEPEFVAVPDVEWRVTSTDGTRVLYAPRPDITVVPRADIRRHPFVVDPPVAVVEVLSPSNRKPLLAAKRDFYAGNGARCYVEVEIADDQESVTISWSIAAGNSWREICRAHGDELLDVAEPFPLTLRPNSPLPD